MSAGTWLIGIVVVPVMATVLSYLFTSVVRRVATVVSGLVTLALSVMVALRVADGGRVAAGALFGADSLSGIFLLVTAFLYAATAIFSIGYLGGSRGMGGLIAQRGQIAQAVWQSTGAGKDGDNEEASRQWAVSDRFDKRFFTGINIFCGAMSAALVLSNLSLVWVAIEITTVVSALLVSLEDTDGASEAAWKYVIIASMGLGLSLLGVLVLYIAAVPVLGSSHALQIGYLVHVHGLARGTVELAFVLAVIGFGTKMGLAPMHTWLPDAHSEAPTPVSALLSGSLLAVSFYVILRFEQVTILNVGNVFPHDVLFVFGVLSLLIAALFLLVQRDVKRMFAYSSVEHMGIIAIGAGFGVPIALAGVMLHVVSHGLAKGTAFFGAGSFKIKFGTKDISRISGGLTALPWSGSLLLAAVAALSALPPFALFRSEFMIVDGGLSAGQDLGVVVLLVLVTVAFAGLSWNTVKIILSPDRLEVAGRQEPSVWMVVPMLAGVVGLILLGLHPPADFMRLVDSAARELTGRVAR
ncbi:MAG: NADH dehydrogenase FAD-containing subunit [Actinobacteria bacterium]|nr:NADH dehydrogenase FAD-containing subunit [Actinomycetota bacterium]MCL5446014.1 NADH dehydrogenase FAD-containing subunit [Actinomycetota bacterium]